MARPNALLMSFWILESLLAARDILKKLPLSDICPEAIKNLITSPRVPCARHLGSLFLRRLQIQISTVGSRLECQGIVLHQLLSMSAISGKHCSCHSSAQRNSEPARNPILSKVVECAQCKSSRCLLGLVLFFLDTWCIKEVRGFVLRLVAFDPSLEVASFL